MTISWQQLDTESDVTCAWRQVVSRSAHATFFHTVEWADAFCSVVAEWQPDPVAIEFSDGNLAVLPMLRRVESEHRQSMAPYVYGGPMFLRAPEEMHLDEFDKVPRWYSDIVLYGSPFAPYPWRQQGLVRWRIHTHVVDLSPGFDSVYAGCRRMIRQHCRGAETVGVTVSIARTIGEVDEYYDAYVDSLRRWGDDATAHYPRSLFHGLFELQEKDQGVRLWVGALDGRVVSGVTVLYRGEHSVAWHAATHSEYLSSNASPLVHMTAIRAACDAGFRWYDFNPSGQLRGVEFFKESFGAKRRQFDMYHSPAFTAPPSSAVALEAATR
jgi:hypothetical protein